MQKAQQKKSSARRVLITGATKGMGKAIAMRMAARGYALYVHARKEQDLKKLAAELSTKGAKEVFYCAADLTRDDQIKNLLDNVLATWTSVDIFINNAGMFHTNSILEESTEGFEDMLSTNLRAPFYLCQGLIPLLKKGNDPHLFTICSISSKQPYAGAAAYTVSKFGLYGLTGVLREELRPHGIKVTAILPGQTLTSSWTGKEDPARFVLPNDIALAVEHCLDLSLGANIEELTIVPVHRKNS